MSGLNPDSKIFGTFHRGLGAGILPIHIMMSIGTRSCSTCLLVLGADPRVSASLQEDFAYPDPVESQLEVSLRPLQNIDQKLQSANAKN